MFTQNSVELLRILKHFWLEDATGNGTSAEAQRGHLRLQASAKPPRFSERSEMELLGVQRARATALEKHGSI